jgi:anti-sigma factor RsiW
MKTFQCGEHTGLVSYVYDECDTLERAAIDGHVAICAACAAEVAALESTRTSLASWAPPAPELG